MPDLGNHVAVVHIPAWITLANEGLGIRVKPQCSRTHYPRLEQHIGILYRDFIAQSVSFPAQFLDEVHVVGMKISASIEPREIVEPDGVDDQRIAFPAADGISIKGHVLGFHGIVIAPIGRNNSKVIGLRSTCRSDPDGHRERAASKLQTKTRIRPPGPTMEAPGKAR